MFVCEKNREERVSGKVIELVCVCYGSVSRFWLEVDVICRQPSSADKRSLSPGHSLHRVAVMNGG